MRAGLRTGILEQRLERSPVAPIHLRSDIPQHVSDYVLQMLSLNANDRPQGFSTIADTVNSFIKEEPVTVPEKDVSEIQEPQTTKRSGRVWLAVVLIIVVALSTLLLFASESKRKTSPEGRSFFENFQNSESFHL